MFIMESAPGAKTVINGREYDYFSGCGYYCLGGHPEVVKAACDAAYKYGIGSSTSRAGFGSTPALIEVEKRAAEFFGAESSLYYVSGYLGNTILLKGLEDDYDIIFADERSHYSITDAVAQTQKRCIKFEHRNPEDLRKKLNEHLKASERLLLISDGVFPETGAISPLAEYYEVLKEFAKPLICVDDAHAMGVIGEKGRGSFEHLGLNEEGLYSSGTLSKAFGGHGGIIAGKAEFIEKLKAKAPLLYASSGTPNPASAATAKSIQILSEHPERRKKLWDNVLYAKKQLRNLGFDIELTPVAIISLHKKGVNLEALQKKLFDEGIAVKYSAEGSYTSVPEGGAIRIAIFSEHTREQIERLLEQVRRFVLEND